MTEINITFPDGATKKFNKSVTGEDIANFISPGLRKQALAIKLDDHLLDLKKELTHGGSIEIITAKDKEGIEVMRHSTAHLMVQAIKRLFKNVYFDVVSVIDECFFYVMYI